MHTHPKAVATYRRRGERWEFRNAPFLSYGRVLFLGSGTVLKLRSPLPHSVLLTLAVVLVMSWIVAQQFTKLFRPWLFALIRQPYRRSSRS